MKCQPLNTFGPAHVGPLIIVTMAEMELQFDRGPTEYPSVIGP
jgi:hypothetical protein